MNPKSKAASFSASNFKPRRGKQRAHRHAPLLLLGALAACTNLETTAPPATMLKGDSTRLEAGRQIYLTQCTDCHSAEPIRNYPASRWPGILDEMAPKTKLSPAQERDVRAYVAAVSKMN